MCDKGLIEGSEKEGREESWSNLLHYNKESTLIEWMVTDYVQETTWNDKLYVRFPNIFVQLRSRLLPLVVVTSTTVN